MKKIKYIIVACICLLSFNCKAQRVLSEVAAMKGVSSVYIGKTMLQLAGASMSITGQKSGIDLSKIFKGLTSIEIISCEDKSMAEKVGEKCKSVLSRQHPMEVITEISNDGQNVQLSGVFDKEGRNLETLLIAVTGKGEASFILLKGKIDVVTLNNAILIDQ